MSTDLETRYENAVAIVGMSGRFPGAAGVDELWNNLTAGKRGLRPLTEEELTAAGVSPTLLANPAYVRYGAPVADIDQFDATVFGFSRREAETMDPQHRLFLECSWEALEVAGYAPTGVPGKVGVFAGSGFPDYINHVAPKVETEPGGGLLMAIGTERDSLASMVSYKFDLRGPSVAVQSFCSTSLVAVHLAVQSLLTFESDTALAGGVYLALPQHGGYLFEEGSIVTPDGRIRSFDAAARGTVLGNGVAVVALKRMTDAIADGDHVHAVILGSAVNNDGRACAGYTAPGLDGQSEVVELAQGVADVKPETVGYVECHATGTMLGDSIEIAALAKVFQQAPPTPTVLSTLKPSLGHLDRASGVAGLIRATMALRNKVLPGTPNFETPLPVLAAASDRLTVLTESQPWEEPADHPRRAGVSSFGFGGTNAHVVLEEAPAGPAGPARPGPHVLTLSARDLSALYDGVERLHRHLDRNRGTDIADVAFTLQQSRTNFMLRWAVVCTDHDDAVAATADPGRWIIGEAERTDAPVTLWIPDDVGPEWWSGAQKAMDALVPGRTRSDGTGVAAAVRSAAALLNRLGMEVAAVVGNDGLATELATELGVPADAPEGAAEFALEPNEDESADSWLRAALAGLWQAGAPVDWAALHAAPAHAPDTARPRRVPLPTYPFQRQRYWIDRPTAAARVAPVPTGKNPDTAQWTYLASWRQRAGAGRAGLADRLRAAGPWLVYAADARGEAVARHLAGAGAEVTTVRPGDAFGRTDDGDFVVRPGDPQDARQLLAAMMVAPRTVVHGFALGTPEAGDDPVAAFDTAQAYGFSSVLALATALDDGDDTGVDLVVLTDGAVEVAGGDLRHPEHASLVGLVPVLPQENPGLSARHVDVGSASAEQILADAVDAHAGPVAWRGRTRWVRAYEPCVLPDRTDDDPIRAGSTVLITGGLGAVGMLVARHLAATRNCRLVLTTRSPLPPRAEWDGLPTDGKAGTYARRVRELEDAGAEVLAMSADVADLAEMTAVVDAARERFGGIDVVVHAAGVQDGAYFGAAQSLTPEVCDAHFRAKVHGFLRLQQILGPDSSTPCVTLSSLSAVLGGITFGAYAASNSALDAYALVARHRGDGAWVTVDWDAWGKEIGGSGDFDMAPADGIAVFDRAVAAADRVGHVVVSTGVLDARIEQWVIRSGRADATADGAGDRPRDPRPALRVPFVEPAEGTERTLADIWSMVLGLEKVGVEDDFYELGGDSIVAIDLIARVRKQFKVSVPVTVLFEQGTVRQLAARLDAS